MKATFFAFVFGNGFCWKSNNEKKEVKIELAFGGTTENTKVIISNI